MKRGAGFIPGFLRIQLALSLTNLNPCLSLKRKEQRQTGVFLLFYLFTLE